MAADKNDNWLKQVTRFARDWLLDFGEIEAGTEFAASRTQSCEFDYIRKPKVNERTSKVRQNEAKFFNSIQIDFSLIHLEVVNLFKSRSND